ncbi:MAG: helix-turn-helix transcriptional regulator [Arenicella sp.]|nr:helix-turn-helix transcriptional regulator [Arenicella sp.]
MTKLSELKAKAFQNEDVKAVHDALDAEFAVARLIIELRNNADLTQEALAELIDAKQSTVAGLESGKQNTTIKMLQRIAEATGIHLKL